MRTGPLGGLAITTARELEIAVVDGALIRREPGRSVTVVASAAEITSMVHLESSQLPRSWRAARRPVSAHVLLLAGDEVRLAVPYVDLVPHLVDDLQSARDVSGLAAMARELGVVIEPAEPDRVPALLASVPRDARVQVTKPLLHARAMRVALPVLLVFVAVLVVRPQLQQLSSVDRFDLVVSIVLVPAVLWTSWVRCRSLWLMTRSPHPKGRTVVPAAFGARFPRALRCAELQVGDDMIMFRSGGREVWVTGPARGGIVTARVGGDAIHLLDQAGVARLVLDARGWRHRGSGTSSLEHALTDHGIDVETTPMPLDASHASDDPAMAGAPGSPWISPWDLGAVVPGLGVVLLVASSVGFLGLADQIAEQTRAGGLVAFVVAVVLIAGPAVAALSVFCWSRSQRTTGRT